MWLIAVISSMVILGVKALVDLGGCLYTEYIVSHQLVQCFSTGVPRNPRVPRASAKGSAAGQ